MSASKQKLESDAAKLRDKIAEAEATLGSLRSRLAKIEGKLTGEPTPETGLDMLWKEAPAMARTRSSKYKCRVAWNRIPAGQRPRISEVLAALKAWKRCFEWKKDDGQFVPALDRWIKERRWEDWPEDVSRDPGARYRVSPPKPAPTDDAIVDPAEIARLLSLKPSSEL